MATLPYDVCRCAATHCQFMDRCKRSLAMKEILPPEVSVPISNFYNGLYWVNHECEMFLPYEKKDSGYR